MSVLSGLACARPNITHRKGENWKERAQSIFSVSMHRKKNKAPRGPLALALFFLMSECRLCQQRPLCWKCHLLRINQGDERMSVNIISLVGPRHVTSLNVPLQDACWSSSCNMWIMNVRMKIRVDLYWRVLVYVMGLRMVLIDHTYTLFPQGADLPDGIHIPYTNGVTLVGFFRWYEVHEDDIPGIRTYFQQTENILAYPRRVMPNFWIELVQVLLSPAFFLEIAHYAYSVVYTCRCDESMRESRS